MLYYYNSECCSTGKSLPDIEKSCGTVLSLPIRPYLTEEEIDQVYTVI